MVYYRAGPFNFTISNNSANTNSITSVLGLNDGKICTLYIGTTAFTLHRVLPKLHSIPNPMLGLRACLLRQILHFCTEASRRDKICQLLRAPSQPFLWLRRTSLAVQWHTKTLLSPNTEATRAVTALYRFHTMCSSILSSGDCRYGP